MIDLIRQAESWVAEDPDEQTRFELQQLISAGDTGELARRFEGTLTFGTAGIRGEVGAGPARMNRAVVIRTTKGLVDYLIERESGVPEGPVVVGFDARPTSRTFAEDTVGVLAAAGFSVRYFPDFAPTPIVAFAAKHLGAVAAVVVTASHNPPADNGYKVYDTNAAQIISPVDFDIAAAIEAAPGAASVPRLEEAFSSEEVAALGHEIFDAYWAEVDASRPRRMTSDLDIVYTPIHGVGAEAVRDVFARAGYTRLHVVPEQGEPDGTFPTVAFPNPEEPGALDLALALGEKVGADLVVANDPDADRLAAVLPTAVGWRPLSGNEIGVLLGDFVLRHHDRDVQPMVFNSIVSSPMLGLVADSYGAHFESTLTGFKWIVNAGLTLEAAGVGEFVFGYEEALGYTVGPTVRDKDGISAALVFADLVASLSEDGQSVLDRLAELWQSHGLWVSAQHSIVRRGAEGAAALLAAVDGLAADPPSVVSGHEVSEVVDFRMGAEERPPWLGAQALVQLELGDRGRILVRPSGTEPKLKVYVDLKGRVQGDPESDQLALLEEATSVAQTLGESLFS